MQNQSPKSEAADAPLRAASSSSNVDIRCAVALAKIALQTMADLHPDAVSTIEHGLTHEIETARLNDDADTLAVIEILSDVRARLAGENARVIGEDSVWYID